MKADVAAPWAVLSPARVRARLVGWPLPLLVLLTMSHGMVYTSHAVLSVLLVDLARDMNTSIAVVSQLIAGMGIAWGLSAPFIGPFSDRFGRRPVFLAGIGTLAVFNVATALIPGFLTMLVCRIGAAVGGATSGPTIYAIVGDAVPPRSRGKAVGWVMLGFTIASMVFVPGLALLAAGAGWRWVFIALATANVTVMALAWRLVPRSAPGVVSSSGFFGQLRQVIRRPDTAVLVTGNLTQQAGAVAVVTFLPAFLIQAFGLRLEEVAPILALVAVGTLVGTLAGGAVSDVGDRVSLSVLLVVGCTLMAIGVLLLSPPLWLAAALATGQAFFRAAYNPAFNAMMMSVSGQARGTMMGLNAMTINLGTALGSATGALAWNGYPGIGWLVVAYGVVSAATFWTGRRALTAVRRAAAASE